MKHRIIPFGFGELAAVRFRCRRWSLEQFEFLEFWIARIQYGPITREQTHALDEFLAVDLRGRWDIARYDDDPKKREGVPTSLEMALSSGRRLPGPSSADLAVVKVDLHEWARFGLGGGLVS